nr:hypothetical protein Iba_scaffold18960CG0020 [Ipomoea batatas]
MEDWSLVRRRVRLGDLEMGFGSGVAYQEDKVIISLNSNRNVGVTVTHPTSKNHKELSALDFYIFGNSKPLEITQPRVEHKANYSFAFY